MTIFNGETSKFEQRCDKLRSILSSTTSTPSMLTSSKPIQIKNDTNSGGHHFVSNHLQQNYLDASCLTKAKLNECLNKRKRDGSDEQLKKSIAHIPFKSYRMVDWSWDYEMDGCCNTDSPPLLLSNDAKSVCFHPYCMGCFETNAIRGNKPLKLNAYTYWEVSLADGICAGTSVMVGIGRKSSKLNSNGYINLIGADKHSWGLSNKGFLWHDNKSTPYCYPFEASESQEKLRIGCLFDGYTGRLCFFKNGVYMGVAFENLLMRNQNGVYDADHELYPMVSSTVSKSVIRLELVCENFASLKEMCRESVQQQLEQKRRCPVQEANFYEACLNQASLSTYLPKTVVDFLSNK